MSNAPVFIDSNVWLYRLFDNQSMTEQERSRKRFQATELTSSGNLVISTQVINEVCSVLARKAAYTEEQSRQVIEALYRRCSVVTLDREILLTACDLRSQYAISFWDGILVASALSANVEVFYSEDLQDGLIVSNRLTIVNPFKN